MFLSIKKKKHSTFLALQAIFEIAFIIVPVCTCRTTLFVDRYSFEFFRNVSQSLYFLFSCFINEFFFISVPFVRIFFFLFLFRFLFLFKFTRQNAAFSNATYFIFLWNSLVKLLR